MVVRLVTGTQIRGAIRYNEQKVAQKQAKVLGAHGFGNNDLAVKNHNYVSDVLENQSEKNRKIKKNTLHFSLSLHPSETISDEKFKVIAHNFMEQMGYKDQPYIIYRHHDTDHPHVHVVTTCVDETGQKIKDSFIKWRINDVRKRLELKYNLIKAQGRENRIRQANGEKQTQSKIKQSNGEQSRKEHLESILRSTFQKESIENIAELQQKLKGQCVNAVLYECNREGKLVNGLSYQLTDPKGNPLSPRIKASEFGNWATWKGIKNKVAKLEQEPSNDGLSYHLSTAQYKILATLIAEQLRVYKKEQRIYHDSTLIEKFPLAAMVKSLHRITKGKLTNEEGLEAVKRFETYKKSQLEGIIKKEQEAFKRTIECLTKIACEMEISVVSKRRYFEANGVTLSGEGEVRSPINRHLNYQIDPVSWGVIRKETGPTVKIPTIYNREERTVILLNEVKKPFKSSYFEVRSKLLEAILTTDRKLAMHKKLNENYVKRLISAGPVVAVELVRYLYQRGLVVDCLNTVSPKTAQNEPTYLIRYKDAPMNAALPMKGLLPAQIQHLNLEKWEQGLLTESGRYMVALAQCIDQGNHKAGITETILALRRQIHKRDATLSSYSDKDLLTILEVRSQQGRGGIRQTMQEVPKSPDTYMNENAIQAQLIPIQAADVFGYEQTGKYKAVGKEPKKRSKGREL
ncbi:relaxase/mobilization nuclease domain-containing protein [Spirosoma sp. HMF3257]|uniref:MobA/VirD2-like nuclease domain-containing protein n=1 Tax=Spirosoma telluris TaxID=2183553 RepID=A0A327NCN8_9BACT|nr:relaxase/mobilization nuclease domain-containing protein [Spirosoma telluris]RAI73010.1 hypothetical protein HMF3257_38495 [Spirosoma telluris]